MEKTGEQQSSDPLLPPPAPSPPPPPAPSPPSPAPSPPSPAPSPPPYYPIPVAVDFDDPPTAYVLLPAYPILRSRPRRRRRRPPSPPPSPPPPTSCCVNLLAATFFIFLFASAAAFLLWPSDPDIGVARLRLDLLRVAPPPGAAIDLHLRLDLRVRNPDFFALDYRSVVSSVGYRGRPLGSVSAAAAAGRVRAWGVSYLDAELRLDGIKVLDDAVYLIEDLARRSIPLDTVTEVEGTLGLFFFQIPVKGRISCSVDVNPHNQKIIRQDCYPE